ncbi:hypothetical protein R5W23_000621, partial [Gemmata sp. JC673]|nr:hypothetical protein [Gemmata algarum]
RVRLALASHRCVSLVLGVYTAFPLSTIRGELQFRDAADAVRMTGVSISDNQVRRLAHEVGRELIARRDRKVLEHRRRPLEPRTAVVPVAVVVEVDGGRIRTRAADFGPGAHEAQNKEDEVACLATLSGPTFAADPCPEPPESFCCPRRVRRLVQPMKGATGESGTAENPDQSTSPRPPTGGPEGIERWSPARLVRTCVASLEGSTSFGPRMAAEAQERRFSEVPRRAFVADGQAYNWTIHRGYFGDFEPIVDFLHAVCYVFSSAAAVSPDQGKRTQSLVLFSSTCSR